MIIFNADDYALTELDNLRICKAFQYEIIKSATVVANSIAVPPVILKNSVSCGIHINLVEGRSLTSPKTITDEYGNFVPKSVLIKRILAGKVSMLEVEIEIAAQFIALQNMGFNISHIDTHQNIHIIPAIFKKIISVGDDFNVKKIRGQYSEYGWFGKKILLKSYIKNRFSTYWHKLLPKSWKASEVILLNAPGLGQVAPSLGHALCLWETALLNSYNPSLIYEVPCHLGLSDFEYQLYTSVDFCELIDKLKIRIGSYHEL